MERKLNIKRVIIVGALVVALLFIVGACIAVITSHGKGGRKSANQPILCEEPVFPATLKGEGGTYTRKLSTYWWVKDVNNGKVILEDVNRFKGAKEDNDDLGVVDLQGRVVITCDNRDVHFTKNGYIATMHISGKSSKSYNFYNMGGNCLATLDSLTDDAMRKYEGDGESKTADSAKLTDSVDGTVRYFGKYAVVSQSDGINPKKQNNTCVYEFKAN